MAWKTVKKSALKGKQKQYECELIERLQAAIPLLLAAIAQALLTLLGAAAEAAGLDRYLKANTHSLLRQGIYWYGAIPTMRDDWFRSLMEAFDKIVSQHPFFEEVFAVI